jgi:hypothetical protein
MEIKLLFKNDKEADFHSITIPKQIFIPTTLLAVYMS